VPAAHGKTKAHGKRFVCRVLANKTHGKLNTHGKTPSLPSVYFMAHANEAEEEWHVALAFAVYPIVAHGKPKYLPCVFTFCRVP